MAGIDIAGLTKVFPGEVRALDALDVSIVDGEFFAAVFPQEQGRSSLRVVEPPLVTDPGHAPWDEATLRDTYGVDVRFASNWTFGVHTPDHDVCTTYGYHVRWDEGDSDYLPSR